MVDDNTSYKLSVGKLVISSEVVSANIIDDINQVFIADGIDAPISVASNLSIRYVTQDQYHDAVVSGIIEPKTLYILSSDQINAYNTTIINVADPQNDKDAVNKQTLGRELNVLSTDLLADAGSLVANDLSNYYPKSQTSSATELSNAFSNVQEKGNYLSVGGGSVSGETSFLSGLNATSLSAQSLSVYLSSLIDSNSLSSVKDLLNSIETDSLYKLDKRHGGTVSGNVIIQGNNLMISENPSTNVLCANSSMLVGNNSMAIGSDNIVLGSNNTCGVKGLKVIAYDIDSCCISVNMASAYFSEVSNDIIGSDFSYVCDGAPQVGMIALDASIINANVCQISSNIYDPKLQSIDKGGNVYFIIPSKPFIGTTVTVGSSFICGSDNHVYAYNAHAEGWLNTVNGNYGHVEGKENVASWGAHAEGNLNQALKVCGHAEGRFNLAYERISHVEGCATSAMAAMAHTAGCRSICLAGDHGSYVWNGSYGQNYTGTTSDGLSSVVPYTSHGPGSFSINPKKGLSGFYIGEQNLCTILGHTSQVVAQLSSQMYSALSILVEDQATTYDNIELSAYCKAMFDLATALKGMSTNQ